MKKKPKAFLSLPDRIWAFTVFCSCVRVTVEQNHNSAPAWRHDSESLLSVLKASKVLPLGEAKGPVSVLEHHRWQCVARKRLLLLLSWCHIALWTKETLVFRAVKLVPFTDVTFTPHSFLFQGMCFLELTCHKVHPVIKEIRETEPFLFYCVHL